MTADANPTTSRRALLAGAVALPLATAAPVVVASAIGWQIGEDPIVSIIAEWQAVQTELAAIIRRVSILREDMEARGVHRFIVVGNRRLYYVEDIERSYFRDCPLGEAAKARQLRQLVDAHARWEAEWEATGGAALWARQSELEDAEWRLIERAWATPARSPAGVAAKLQLVAAYARRPDDADDDMHVLALRNLLDDLARMTAA